jgi:hypothetical protein
MYREMIECIHSNTEEGLTSKFLVLLQLVPYTKYLFSLLIDLSDWGLRIDKNIQRVLQYHLDSLAILLGAAILPN